MTVKGDKKNYADLDLRIKQSLTPNGFLVPEIVTKEEAALLTQISLEEIAEEFRPFAMAGISAILRTQTPETGWVFLKQMFASGLHKEMDHAILDNEFSNETKLLLNRGICTILAAQAASVIKEYGEAFQDVGSASVTTTYELPMIQQSDTLPGSVLLSGIFFAKMPPVSAVLLRYRQTKRGKGIYPPLTLSFATPVTEIEQGRTISGFTQLFRSTWDSSGIVEVGASSGTIRDGVFPVGKSDASFVAMKAFSQMVKHSVKSFP